MTCYFQYTRCWQEWQAFCHQHQLETLSVNPEHVIAYLVHVSKLHSPSVATAYTHLSAIAYHYRVAGKPSITENISVSLYMKGLKRRNVNKPVKRAKPMTPDVLRDMRKLLEDERKPTIVIWRTVLRAHLEFGLLLRFDDIKR